MNALAYWTLDQPDRLHEVDAAYVPQNKVWFLFDEDCMIVRSSGHAEYERQARSTLLDDLVQTTIRLTLAEISAVETGWLERENGTYH